MKQTLLAIAALVFSATGSTADDQTPDGAAASKKAWIEISETGPVVTIKVMSELDSNVGGTYRLEVTKAGPAGRSVNRQSGTIRASEDAAPETSSVSRVSVETGAALDVLLTVEDSAGEVYEDRFSKTY